MLSDAAGSQDEVPLAAALWVSRVWVESKRGMEALACVDSFVPLIMRPGISTGATHAAPAQLASTYIKMLDVGWYEHISHDCHDIL